MIAASEIQWFAEGQIAYWQAYEPSVKVDLSCAAIRIGRGLVLIDPIPLAEPALAELTAHATPVAVVLTSGNHERAAAWYAQRFSIPVLAHRNAAPEFSLAVNAFLEPDTEVLEQIETLSGNSANQDTLTGTGTLRVVDLSGGAPGEIALVWSRCGGVLLFGDAIVNLESTGLIFLPDKYCTAPKALRAAVQTLSKVPASILTFAHGLPITQNAAERLATLCGEA